MTKWEYKTVEFRTQKEHDDQIPALGALGWEAIYTKPVNGWIVCSLKRPAEDTLFSFDSFDNIMNVLANPEKAKALITELKAARVEHDKGAEQFETAKKEAEQKLQDLEKRQTELTLSQSNHEAEKAKLEKDKASLAAAIKIHAENVARFNEESASRKAALEKDVAAFTTRQTALANAQASMNEVQSRRMSVMDAREAALNAREEQLSRDIKEYNEIKEQATAFANRLGKAGK